VILLPCNGRMQVGGKLRGAVLVCLKEMMRQIGFDAHEIVLQRRAVRSVPIWLRWLYQEVKFRAVYLKSIDLLMMEGVRADDGFGGEELPAGGTQSGIGRERSVFCEPGADGALRDLSVVALSQKLLGLGEGVAEGEG
jgi:hypothetical protein